MSSSPSLESSESVEPDTFSSESLESSTDSSESGESSTDSSESLESSSDSMDDPIENNRRVMTPTPETKTRKTITHEVVSLVIRQISRKNRPSVKVISENVGLACSTVHKLLRELREGKHDYGDFVVYRPVKKGRKPVITEELCERVKEILTSSPTETIDSAKERLHNEGVDVSRSTVYRMAQSQHISHQMIVPKPAAVFTRRITQQRFDYATRVNDKPDQELWFLDESGFNLHVAPLRCWSVVGVTPVEAVPVNRGKNVSLLMLIAPDGIVFYETKQGAFNGSDFVLFLEALAARFREVRNGDVCLVMDNARIHHAVCAREFMVENGINHLYLPPYSPDLNPIENVFGTLKTRFRKRGVVRSRNALERRIQDVIDGMNLDMDIHPYYRRMRKFVGKAIRRQSFN